MLTLLLGWLAAWNIFTFVWLVITHETRIFEPETAQRNAFSVSFYILAGLTYLILGFALIYFESYSTTE